MPTPVLTRLALLTSLASLALIACEGGDGITVDPALLTDGGGADRLPAGEDAASPDGAAPALDLAPAADWASDRGPDLPDADAMPDAGPTVDAAMPPDQGPLPRYPARACAVTVDVEAPGANQVRLAGDFTGWADNPLLMQRVGDGRFQLTLDASHGLRPGVLHAYKTIVDGQWRIHADAPYRKYDGDCVNSGLKLPACDAPEIEVVSLTVSPAGDGRLVLRPWTATGGADIEQIRLLLDGAPLAWQADGAQIVAPLLGLAPGKHRITVEAEDAAGAMAGPFHLPFWVEARPFDWRDSVLYLLFLDRFANGDRSNDGTIGPPVDYAADWHGGDLQGALAVLESGYFERLGVKSIWLSPINAQIDGHWPDRGDGSQRYASYHGYWPIRGREIDARYGGNAGLRAFIQAAHARGIRVLLDLINNQIHEEHEYYQSNPEWFRTACVCGVDPGCGWSERPLDCLFAPYLPDINWRVPGAEAQFTADALYWVEEFDVDGFRVDAVKHVETLSVYNLRAALADRFERGGHRVVMLGETAVGEGDAFNDGCGETYRDGYEWISAYTGPTGLDGQFDFPTHHRIQWGLLTGQQGFDQIEGSVAQYERRYDPSALHVQFLGSHDSSRMASRAAFDPAQNCTWPGPGDCAQLPRESADPAVYQRLRRAFTVLLTLPGIPLLYQGDEIALAGGNDPDSRRDMWWTGPLEAVELPGGGDPSALQESLRGWIEAIGAARAAWPSLTRGARAPLLVTADLYVYARHLDGEVSLVVVNRGGAVDGRSVPLGALGPGGFQPLVGEARAEADGTGLRLTVGAGEAAILGRRRP